MTLGQAIRTFREKRGLSLRALARAVGLSAPFLSDLEHDRRNTDKLPAIARALGVRARELERHSGHVDRATLRWLRAHPDVVAMLRARARR